MNPALLGLALVALGIMLGSALRTGSFATALCLGVVAILTLIAFVSVTVGYALVRFGIITA